MSLRRALKVKLYNILRTYRFQAIHPLLDPQSKTLLDIGCSELYFYLQLKDRYQITLADYEPQHELIQKENVQALSFPDRSFDIVLCQQVLEHVLNPVQAISELKRITKKQLLITVPYEPFFTMARFFLWEKNHLWAVTPGILRHYLGPPDYEKKILLKRYYLALWNFKTA